MHKNLYKIIALLNTKRCYSVQDLSLKLEISTTTVYNALKKLKAYGITIHKQKGSCYALVDNISLYEKAKILAQLKQTIGSNPNLQIFTSIGSTNDYLKNLAWRRNKLFICLAEQQTQGRGRFSRSWYSPFAQNIYLSLGIQLKLTMLAINGISLIVGLAILNGIKEYGITTKLSIKWPNDILWNDKKIAGILIETKNFTADLNYCQLIIGVGLNLNMPSDLNYAALQQITGTLLNKNTMAVLLINNILQTIQNFSRAGLKYFMPSWRNCDYLYNKKITVITANGTQQGIAKSIDQYGRLLLQLANGSRIAIASGDVTIKKQVYK